MPRPGEGVNRAADGAGVALRPETGCEARADAAFVATAASPWLRLALDAGPLAGRWVRIRYRAGRFRDPVRPLLRIERGEGRRDVVVMPGPVCGGACWVGPLPSDLSGLALSPVRDPGPFNIAVDEVGPLSRLALVRGAVRRRPGLALVTLTLRLRGKRLRSRHLLSSIWNSTPPARYAEWLAERESGPPLAEPWIAPATEPVLILIDAAGAVEADVATTIGSLEHQGENVAWALAGETAPAASVDAGEGWVAVVRAGDVLAPDAITIMLAAGAGALDLVYSDEDSIDERGVRSAPILKPDWSPRFHESVPYLGGLALVRRSIVSDLAGAGGDVVQHALSGGAARIGHVRRILFHRRTRAGPLFPMPQVRPSDRRSAEMPLVSIIIPSRDRLALLEPCIAGLRERTAYPNREIVLVDNGSLDPATHRFYRSLAADPAVSVLERPGPFNFSALTNAGVRVSRGPVLLLLNNDIDVIGADWLDILVAEAMRPEAGAVGAKLIYPDGRLQHGGVAVGLGGAAGHLCRGRAGADPGWLGRFTVRHEVSAVTGACLAVSRDKYDAVGGLDEVAFPISFNDIDFCLKLRERGWTNIQASDALLFHRESASRGSDIGPKQLLADLEAARFKEKWIEVIRDDPFYHPGLSLARFDASLG